jgi:hypothetical protein
MRTMNHVDIWLANEMIGVWFLGYSHLNSMEMEMGELTASLLVDDFMRLLFVDTANHGR